MSMVVNCAAYAGGRRVADVEIQDIGQVLKQEDRFVWIGLHEPTEDLLKQVQAEFGLHDLAIEDANRAHQRPKLERFSLISVSQNEAMKRLTGWAAIIAVPTMIAGVYGMNFKWMPELEWPLGYPLIMGLMLATCAFLYIRFRRAGWL